MTRYLKQREYLDWLVKHTNSSYIVIETKYTRHHIERLSSTCEDRGKWKWIAKTYGIDYEKEVDEEGRRSHIDACDLFPMLYFLDDSLCSELFTWLQMRDLDVIDIRTTKI